MVNKRELKRKLRKDIWFENVLVLCRSREGEIECETDVELSLEEILDVLLENFSKEELIEIIENY